jgi:PAS domain S-box-containing protein
MAELLQREGVQACTCATAADCAARISAGIGALLFTEEALELPGASAIFDALTAQPSWSELPLLVLTRGGERRVSTLLDLAAPIAGSLTVLERPMSAVTLLRSVQVALRSRQRQYEVRDLLAELHRQKDELRQSQATLQAFYDSSPLMMGVVELVPDGMIAVHGNRRVAEFLGVNPEQLPGRTSGEVNPAREVDEVWMRAYQQCLAARGPVQFEYPHPRASGPVWIGAAVAPLPPAESGRPRCSFFAEDITDRKRAEQAARDKEALAKAAQAAEAERQRFLDVLDTLPVVIDIIRADHRVEWSNRACREAFGETTGLLCHQSQFNRDTPCEECQAFTPLKTGQPHHWEWTLPNGRTFDIYNFPFAAADGSPAVLEMDIDITEIRQAQAQLKEANEKLEQRVAERTRELRESRERYRGIVETAHEGIWTIDATGRTTYVNQRMADLLGYAPAEIMGRVHTDFMWEEDRPKGEAGPGERGEGARGVWDQRYRRKDGSVLWTITSRTALLDPAGQATGTLGMFTDITARKQAEEALRASEQRFRLLAEAMPQVVWTANADGIVDYYNAQAIAHGLVVTGQNDSDWGSSIHPDDVALTLKTWREAREHGWTYQQEFRLRLTDGTYHWHLARALPQRDDKGAIVKWIGTTTDIHDLRQAQEALRESEQRLRLAKSAARLGIHEYRPPAGELVWDDRMRELWGIGPNDPVNYDVFMSRLHPEDRAPTQAAVDRALDPRGSGIYYAEYRLVHPDRTLWVAATGDVTFEYGLAVRLIGTVQDITARKEAEAVLARDKETLERLVAERTAKLNELVGELEHFSYTITHDMRAPLRAMRGFAGLVQEMSADSLSPESAILLRKIDSAAERMDLLITDALSYSQAVRQQLILGPVDLGCLLRGMVDSYPEFQSAKDHIHLQPDIPLVLGNQAGLTQVFSNLLANAIKFAKPGHPPEIRIWSETISPRPESFPPSAGASPKPDYPSTTWIRVWVEDNGVGICESMLPRVFNMFSRGNHQRAGTGIGLALVRKVVDRMGGRVGVQSQEGRGARFWLELLPGDPRRPAPAPTPTAPSRPDQIL